MNLSIVIPAFNESENIQRIIGSLTDNVKSTKILQIIIVDDHSQDNTFADIAAQKQARVQCIRLSRRSGSHTALRAGLKVAEGEAVLCISADGQEDPAVIDAMLAKVTAGTNVVWGLRKSRKDESWQVRIPATLFRKMIFCMTGSNDAGVDLSRADFFLLDRKVVEAINSCPERNTSLLGLISWLGFRQDFVEYERRQRSGGASKWNFRSRLRLAKDWTVAFSGLPLKLMTWVGFLVAISGFIFALYTFFNALFGHPAQGWSSIIIAILFVGGVQMMMLGIIGEYLWRTLDETRQRPNYFIENDTKNK